jgi:type 2A phosphatase activator TIP41
MADEHWLEQNLLMTGLMPDAITIALRDSNQVANLLPVVDHILESVSLGSAS